MGILVLFSTEFGNTKFSIEYTYGFFTRNYQNFSP